MFQCAAPAKAEGVERVVVAVVYRNNIVCSMKSVQQLDGLGYLYLMVGGTVVGVLASSLSNIFSAMAGRPRVRVRVPQAACPGEL